MGSLAVGVDVVEVARMQRLLQRYDAPTLGLVFSDGEQRQAAAARRAPLVLAVCFGAKEAVGKALGTGLAGISWTDIEAEVRRGGLRVALRGAAREQARRRRLRTWHASWTSAGGLAIVSVVAS